ncbi:MAG: CehA/McbA family metallohydrolase [Candidatus Bathyarchaeota archaeon]|nr:CehA/McbA family metallohydrolase [Candidatus Bathyarchaeota archaeon]
MRTEFNNPFEARGHWFRGNLHTHSSNSDGNLTVKQLVSLYRRCGYDFLSITDHGKLTETGGLSTPEFLLIPGEEVIVGTSEAGTLLHIVAINIEMELPVGEADSDESPQRAIDLVREQGGEAVVAHPYWSGLTFNDLIGLEDYLGLEVYNTNCDLTINRGLSNVHWDNLLASGRRLLGFAFDDAHSENRANLPMDSCGGWISVKAESLTIDSLMASIRRGLFYSSIGPEIRDIHVEEGCISASTSPVKTISFVSNSGLGERHTAESGYLTVAAYTLRGTENYVRVETSDEHGRAAWSNPIYIEPS